MAFRTVSGTNSGTKSSMKMKCSTLLQKLPNNQLKGTTKMNYITVKEIAEKSSNVELLKAVHCKMDSRGRITIPKVFRGMFKGVENGVLCGSIHYVEIRRK